MKLTRTDNITISWYAEDRMSCDDTKCFIETYMPIVPSSFNVAVNVFELDVVIVVYNEVGKFISKINAEFWTS